MSTAGSFEWFSPLGAAVALLLTCSAVYALIAVGGLVVTHRYGVGRVPASPSIFLSADVEADLFGRATVTVLDTTPGLGRILGIVMDAFLAMMLGFALLLAAIAWFAVPTGEAWALGAAVIGQIVMLAIYWLVAIGPFLREAGVSYPQVWHPYAVVPTILVPIAAILGWIGLG
jgi:hypothetical protein